MRACGCISFVGAALFAGCSGGTPSSVDSVRANAALTTPHHVAGPVHTDRGKSWMLPGAKSTKRLLYVGDWGTNDVFVYDYPSRKQVGQLTGFNEPYGMCVDAKGDVYVTNFGDGNAVEYAHGGTKVLNTYDSGGAPIGCAVDKKGDVAVTSFDPGEATVFAKGDPNKGTSYSDSACAYLSTMGYDEKGNLIGDDGDTFCALLAGSKRMTTLTYAGININSPGGTTWDGKYIAIGDQEAGGTYETGIVQATLSGTTLTGLSEITFSDDCYSDYVDDVNPFVVGKKNTPVNDKQGSVMAGPNLWCYDAGTAKVDYWHYPGGGSPFKSLGSPPREPYGAAVSIAQ